RHTRFSRDWSSDVCSSDLLAYDADFGRRVFARDGDLWLYDLGTRALRRLTATREAEANPRFSPDGRRVVFTRGDNVFSLDLAARSEERRVGKERRSRWTAS